MTEKHSYIKEAEQNALNLCKYYTDMIDLIDSMERGMVSRIDEYRYDEHGPKQKMRDGFRLVRQALYEEQQRNLARCFLLVGVGGEEAEKYSRTEAKRAFGGRYSVTELLDEYFRLPSCWKAEDEENLEKELKEALGGEE